jgi:hypothetical protein
MAKRRNGPPTETRAVDKNPVCNRLASRMVQMLNLRNAGVAKTDVYASVTCYSKFSSFPHFGVEIALRSELS